MHPSVQPFFDPVTGTVSYVVYEQPGSACAVIDPVLDYDPKSSRTTTGSADRIVAFVREQQLQLQWILETHAHADHLTAAPWLREQLGGKIAIGGRIRTVQGVFQKIFNLEPGFAPDGSQFDRLLEDGETFAIGKLQAQPIPVPGHTPACLAYRIGDAVFVGDTLFMPDVGSARCDFPGGRASSLRTER
jgi:glyoxylase-like metal-dependent hydrolase (beta-lactamase superfamily II)